jgi:hypothetical protein
VNGRATSFGSVLQAGTAVLVDKYGHPVARCRCGNPLTEPTYFKSYSCTGCPPHYRPPTQCKLYSGDTDYDKDYYSGPYYSNDEYDKKFVDSSKSSSYSDCYEAYPDPPSVTSLQLYRVPAAQSTPSTGSPGYTTTEQYHGLDCNNPRSQYEYEQCHPSTDHNGQTGTNPDYPQYPPGQQPPSDGSGGGYP